MKTRILALLVTLSLPVSRTQAQTLDFRQLPGVVQQAINDQRGAAGVTSVERVDQFGTPVYHVRLGPPAIRQDLYLTDTGSLINVTPTVGLRPLEPGAEQVALGALPQVVQRTIRKEVGNVPVPNLERVVGNGQTSYVLPVRLDQRVVDLWVDRDGNILSFSPPRGLLSGTTRLTPDQLPGPVQETLRNYSSGAPISNVTRGIIDGRTVYDTLFKRAGRNVDLRIAQDGSLIRDAVTDRFLADLGQMSRAGLAAVAPARVPLTDLGTVSFNQLPAPVLAAIQNYGGADFISQIQTGMAAGRRFYEAVLQHGGQSVPLRLTENGAVVDDKVNDHFLAQLDSARVGANAGLAPLWQQQTGGGVGP